jgi:hypothetical protein
MKANLKVILSAMGVASLLASSAMAQQHARRNNAAPSPVYVPSDARGSVTSPTNEGGPYSPSLPTSRYGENRDFQNGSTN